MTAAEESYNPQRDWRLTLPHYQWDCPKCGAKAGERCRSLKTGRITDVHVARYNLRWSRP